MIWSNWYLCLVQTVHEGRIYQLKLFCDKDYPEKPPTVRFHSRINMTCVNHETGVVRMWIFEICCFCFELVYSMWKPAYRWIQRSLGFLQTGKGSTQWRTYWLNWRRRWLHRITGSLFNLLKEPSFNTLKAFYLWGASSLLIFKLFLSYLKVKTMVSVDEWWCSIDHLEFKSLCANISRQRCLMTSSSQFRYNMENRSFRSKTPLFGRLYIWFTALLFDLNSPIVFTFELNSCKKCQDH